MMTALPALTERASGARRVSEARSPRRAGALPASSSRAATRAAAACASPGGGDLAQRTVARPCPDATRRQPRQPQGGFQGALGGRLPGRGHRVTKRARVGELHRQPALRPRRRECLGHARGEDRQRNIRTRRIGALTLGKQQLQDSQRLAASAQHDREHGACTGAARERGRAVATGHDRVVVPQCLERQGIERTLSHGIGEPRAEARQHVQAVLLDGVQERAVGAARAARQPRGHACDRSAVVRRRERLAGDVEQLRQTRLDAAAGAREGQRGLRRDVPQQLALGLAERVRPRTQDLEHAHRAVHPADRQGEGGRCPAALQAARDGGLERRVEIGFTSAHGFLETAVQRRARAGQLGLQRGRIDVHGARDEHAAGRVEDAHEHRVCPRELRRHAREQRQCARVVALARRGGGLVERGELRGQPARADGGVGRLERTACDLGNAVREREILRGERLAGIAAAEHDGDARALGVAQREREHRGRPAVSLERDVARLARDRGTLVRERARREAAVGAQVPALHPAGAPARAGRDHEPPIGLAHRDRRPVAGEAFGRRAADRVQHAIEIERDPGQQAGSGAHAIGDRGSSPQRRRCACPARGRRGADPLEHATRSSKHGLGGLERRARDLCSQLDEGALQRADERDEAESALDAAGHLALEHKRRERRAVRVAQRALEGLERLLAARAHARERHALGREHLMRGQ